MPKVSDDHLAARRSQILDGARRCFAEFGYEGATVRRLEEAIGLSRGAIFHHFRDKDALFLALAQEDAERMADIAANQGLVQVMREMLANPEQHNWLGTRLERRKAAGALRDDVPTDVLLGYLDLVLDGLIARIASGHANDNLTAVLDLVEASVRRKA